MDKPRTDSARAHDDAEIIENMEVTPTQGGTKGGNLQRDIGSRAEQQRTTGNTAGVTRARASDKPKQANLPRRNED